MANDSMSNTVTLFTDRNQFPNAWRPTLEKHGLYVAVRKPSEIANVSAEDAVVFDAGAESYSEDELLAAVGFARAMGAVPYVQLPNNAVLADIEDVLAEMCDGNVARDSADVVRLAASIPRRLDRERTQRFEFVTVSPREAEVLAILGDGSSVLLSRPICPADDGSAVTTISLDDSASTATLELASGAVFQVFSRAVAPRDHTLPTNIPIDGVRLGARLKELRLEAGLTQAELARRTGIHRPNIARVEAGRHTPSLETLSRIASAIGVPTTRVLSQD